MNDEELDILDVEHPKKMHFEWLIPIFFKPRATFEKIAKQNNGVWLTPMLVLTVLLIILALVNSPIRALNAQMGATLPPDFEYYSIEQQQKILAAQQSMSSPVFTMVFPALGSLAGLWLGWLILSSILHFSLTLAGSSNRIKSALNIVGWAFMPFALRYLVQIFSALITKQLISSPGLSGFFATDMGNFQLFLNKVFVSVDIYYIWQVILVALGVISISSLSRGKSWAATLVSILVVLLLMALPGYLSTKIGGAGTSTPFYFF
jgi:hypothetical protein